MTITKKLLGRIRKVFSGLQERLLFRFANKKDNYVFFYPHPNGRVDGYDIINYHSDNVLHLINYLLMHKEYSWLHLIVVVFDEKKIRIYQDYVNNINPNQEVTFVKDTHYNHIVKYAASSKLIFTDTGHTYFRYKSKKQQLVCLNYYIPFKDDYVKDKKLRQDVQKRNNTFDYFILTSYIPSLISSVVRCFPLEQFLMLGFCRNDVFYLRDNKVKKTLSDHFGYEVKRFIVYTPTYRDYEYNTPNVIERDLFGYSDTDYDSLEQILEDSCSVIIAKLHPLQINVRLSNHKGSHIVMYQDLAELKYSLYEYLSEADGLITDYTSTYFDFLHRNRPVIFNFYDFDKYEKVRGFALNPIRPFCAGDQVETSQELISAIKQVLKGIDKYREQRGRIAPLFDNYYDGNNTKRVCEYFLR